MLHHYPDPGVDCRWRDSQRWWQALTAPELRLVISCDELEVFRFTRQGLPNFTRELLDHKRYALPGNGQDMLPPEVLWQTLDTVLSPLAGQYWHVVVVVSNQYARWLVLPWQAELRSQADREAYYLHGLQQAFASDMQDWQVRAQAGGYGQATLVNALPAALSEKLHEVLAEHRLSPGVIAPAWVLSVNQALYSQRQQRRSADGWIVCRESGLLTIGCLMQEAWQQVRQLPVGQQWQQSLVQLLQRELVVHPERAGLPVYLPKLNGVMQASLAPFEVLDILPAHGLGELFNQSMRRRMADASPAV